MRVVSSSNSNNRDASSSSTIKNNDESDSTREDSSDYDDSCTSASSLDRNEKVTTSGGTGNEKPDGDYLGTSLALLSPESKTRLKFLTTHNSVTITTVKPKPKSTAAPVVPRVVPQWHSESTECSSDDEAYTTANPPRNIYIESVDNNSGSSAVLEQLREFREVTITPVGDGDVQFDDESDDDDDDNFDVEAIRARLRSVLDISKHPRVLRANIGFSEISDLNKQKLTIDMFFLSGNKVSKEDFSFERIYMYQVSKDQISSALQNENDIHCSLLVLPYQLGPGPETKEIDKKRLLANMDIFSSFIRFELSEGEMEFHNATNVHHKFFYPPCDYVDRKIKEALPDLVPCLSDIPYAYFIIKKDIESKRSKLEHSSTNSKRGG